jgi:hypothetical protein
VGSPIRCRADKIVAVVSLGRSGELAGVEQFFGQDALVALDLAVVPRGVGLRLLVPGLVADDPGEVAGSVAGAVVGHDAVDLGDSVCGEPDLRPCEERGCGGALLVGQRFGVSQTGEAVDDGVQVDVAALRTS